MSAASRKIRAGAAGLALLAMAGTAVAVTPGSASAASSGKVGVGIPASAFKTYTGISATTVKIANVSTHFETLFTGAAVGTQAYVDYINSKGGVGGRKLVLTAQDTHYSGTANAQLVQSDLTKAFAMVGSFSVTATSGDKVLAKNPQMADVTVTPNTTTNKLPNFVSPFPEQGGWQEGPLVYLKNKYPTGVKHVGVLLADVPAATQAWAGEEGDDGAPRVLGRLREHLRDHRQVRHIRGRRRGHEVQGRPDALHRAEPARLRGPGDQGDQLAELPPQGGPRRLDLLGLPHPDSGRGRRHPGHVPRAGPLLVPGPGRQVHPGRGHLPALGAGRPPRGGRSTSSPSMDGSRPNCSPRG